MLREVIFQKLHAHIIHVPSVRAFYAFVSPLFYNHYNYVSNVTIIPFAKGIRQSDPLRGALFALIHFKALCFIVNHFPFCLFLFIVDDIHIIGPLSIVPFIYEHFKTKLCLKGSPHFRIV
jgi:hypothetical protein